MNKKMWLFALMPLSIVFFVGIIFITQLEQNKVLREESGAVEVTDSSQSAVSASESTTQNEVELSEPKSQLLAVDPNRCRGCGKCAMVDSEHFTIEGRTATVISQDNLASSTLKQAISICPEGAITLS